MTNGEALERIKKGFYFDEEGLDEFPEARNCKCAIDLAKQALEKQIPKPVVQSTDDCTRCPVCGGYVGIDMEEMYCSACGQALDWEDSDDES